MCIKGVEDETDIQPCGITADGSPTLAPNTDICSCSLPESKQKYDTDEE